MSVDDFIINRKTHSVLDMGSGFHSFCGTAERDLTWVNDRELLTVVMTEGLAHWDCGKTVYFENTVRYHVDIVWSFVRGAEPSDIEITWDGAIHEWKAFDTLKQYTMYGSRCALTSCIVNHQRKTILRIGTEPEFARDAEKDKSWVTDSELLQVLFEEHNIDSGNWGPGFKEFLEGKRNCIWNFIAGAAPSDIEMHADEKDAQGAQYVAYRWIRFGEAFRAHGHEQIDARKV